MRLGLAMFGGSLTLPKRTAEVGKLDINSDYYDDWLAIQVLF